MRNACLMLVCGLAPVSVAARADNIPPCPLPAGATAIVLPAGLPDAIARNIADRLGTRIAAPGEAFDATDVVQLGIGARYIFAWKIDTAWIVALERGGRGYGRPVFRYEPSPMDAGFRMTRSQRAGMASVCETAAMLAKP
jgi:hypothetical protein